MYKFSKLQLFVAALVGISACATPPPPPPPPDGERVAKTVSNAFVHCLAQEGGMCVDPAGKRRPWDALNLLIWLYRGSPPAILQGLQGELDRHVDPHQTEAQVVQVAAKLREQARGADCQAKKAVPIETMVEALQPRVRKRVADIGLDVELMGPIIDGLTTEASQGMAGGYMVYLKCEGDLNHLWLATSVHQNRQVVAGIRTQLPTSVGGKVQPYEAVEDSLSARENEGSGRRALGREGMVDSSWIPFAVEEF